MTQTASISTANRVRAPWGSRLAGALAGTLAVLASIMPHAAGARPAPIAPDTDATDDRMAGDALPYRQCVPFARQVSGIQLFGDAHTWWDQAQGHYARGHAPRVGAVMSFHPHGPMTLGHVAMVSKVIDERTVLLRHANWSPIDGRRGHVEMDVRAVDVSPGNDWSAVRVWYAPIGDLGTTHWPVDGFIYKRKPAPGESRARAVPGARLADQPRVASRIDARFLDGIRPEPGSVATRSALTMPPRPHAATPALPVITAHGLRDDPIGRIIAAHMKRAAR